MYQPQRSSQRDLQGQGSTDSFSFPANTFSAQQIQRTSSQDSIFNVDFTELWNRDLTEIQPDCSTAVNRVIRTYNQHAQDGISKWMRRIERYKPYSYIGEPSNDNSERKNKLDTCENILFRVMEAVEEKPANFRGLFDKRDELQAAATVEKQDTHLQVEDIVVAPWNILQNTFESVKGAGTALMEDLIKESAELGFEGRLRLIAISGTEGFYQKIGFQETDRGDFELTSEAAKEFLERQESRRQAMRAS